MTTSGVPFRKGHGTGNEFILVSGLDGYFADPKSVTPTIAQNICDRDRGLGARDHPRGVGGGASLELVVSAKKEEAPLKEPPQRSMLTAPLPRSSLYHSERLQVTRSLAHGSYGPALRRLHAGAVAARRLQVDSTLRAGGSPGALRLRLRAEEHHAPTRGVNECHATTHTKRWLKLRRLTWR